MLVLFIALLVCGAMAGGEENTLAADVAASRDFMSNVQAYLPQLVADEDNNCGFTAAHQEIFNSGINTYLECLGSVESQEAFDACGISAMDAETSAAEAAGLELEEVSQILGCAVDSAPQPQA